MASKETPVTLLDGDIVTERGYSRRIILGTLGLGAGAVTLAGRAGPVRAQSSDPENRGKRCEYRDGDPSDVVRVNCGRTDTD